MLRSVKHTNYKGFTLIELSIVIIIIGLLIAGIAGGISLSTQVKLQTISSDFTNYRVVFESFLRTYNAYPGDFSNATVFFGSSAINGNGNGSIQYGTVPQESFIVWQHLNLAGLIEASFKPAATTVPTIGINLPTTAINNGTFYPQIFSGPDWLYSVTTQNILNFGQTSSLGQSSILTPAEAYNIDSKIDDGRPSSGSIYGFTGRDVDPVGNNVLCVTTDGTGSQVYALSANQVYCFMIMPLGNN
jgi:prepilin-type N-terminal cleavage/methylation domain-containing protein